MSFFDKLGAVVVGTGSAVGWLATNAVKATLEKAADTVGNGTSSTGYTSRDYKNQANLLETKNELWKSGFDKAQKLWKGQKG